MISKTYTRSNGSTFTITAGTMEEIEKAYQSQIAAEAKYKALFEDTEAEIIDFPDFVEEEVEAQTEEAFVAEVLEVAPVATKLSQGEYTKGQFIAISYTERKDGKYETHINRIFKIVKAEQVAADGVEMLVDGIHTAVGKPLREGINRPWDVTVNAQDGSIHKFTIKNYPHQLYVNGKWEVIKKL